jgi:hypothetical protein
VTSLIQRELFRDFVLGAIALFALVFLAVGMSWQTVRDTPFLLYEGFLSQQLDIVPYRDYFEVNAPGTVLVFGVLQRLSGGGDLALRFVDLLVLAGICAFTFIVLGRHGWRSGLLACALFAGFELSTGPENALQREYLSLLPLAISLALVFRRSDLMRGQLYPLFLAGLMMGSVATIKPPLAICWIPLFAYDLFVAEPRFERWGRKLALVAAGALAPVILVVGWLAWRGALAPFVEMAVNYYPLYTQIDGNGAVLPQNVGEFLKRYLLRTLPLLAGAGAAPALLGLVAGAGFGDRLLRAQNAALAGLVAAAAFYVPISGKFWVYHRIPLFYALALAAALLFSTALERPAPSRLRDLAVALALLASLPLAQLAIHFVTYWEGHNPRGEQVEKMADYLRQHTTPADTILPLDVSTGAAHALLEARRPFYGRFITDFHFYHHHEELYMIALRRQFLAQFRDGQPTVILRCHSWRPRDPAGPEDFPELDAILRSEYAAVLETSGCTVLRRR